MNHGDKIALFQNVQRRLSTLEGSRAFYAEVIDAYSTGLIPERDLRALVYALSSFLSYHRAEADVRFEERLEALERAVEKAVK